MTQEYTTTRASSQHPKSPRSPIRRVATYSSLDAAIRDSDYEKFKEAILSMVSGLSRTGQSSYSINGNELTLLEDNLLLQALKQYEKKYADKAKSIVEFFYTPIVIANPDADDSKAEQRTIILKVKFDIEKIEPWFEAQDKETIEKNLGSGSKKSWKQVEGEINEIYSGLTSTYPDKFIHFSTDEEVRSACSTLSKQDKQA